MQTDFGANERCWLTWDRDEPGWATVSGLSSQWPLSFYQKSSQSYSSTTQTLHRDILPSEPKWILISLGNEMRQQQTNKTNVGKCVGKLLWSIAVPTYWCSSEPHTHLLCWCCQSPQTVIISFFGELIHQLCHPVVISTRLSLIAQCTGDTKRFSCACCAVRATAD